MIGHEIVGDTCGANLVLAPADFVSRLGAAGERGRGADAMRSTPMLSLLGMSKIQRLRGDERHRHPILEGTNAQATAVELRSQQG